MPNQQENESSANNSDDSSLCKPNCTITEQHDELLDDMAEERYASRSEALRAAIQDHVTTLDGDDEITFNHVADEVAELRNKIDDLCDQIKTLQPPFGGPTSTNSERYAAQLGHERESVVNPDDAVSSTSMNEVYDAVNEVEPATAKQVAEQSGLELLETRRVLDNLVDQEFVIAIDENNPVQYRIKR